MKNKEIAWPKSIEVDSEQELFERLSWDPVDFEELKHIRLAMKSILKSENKCIEKVNEQEIEMPKPTK